MKFTVAREQLIRPMSLVNNAIERRSTLPILTHMQLVAENGTLTLTGLDLEVEMKAALALESLEVPGRVTVPARKLTDICKSLPKGTHIEFSLEDNRMVVRSGASRFTLTTLPAQEFPFIEAGSVKQEITLPQQVLRRVIDRVAFAMGFQDVRYYLNGMLFELEAGRLRTVATDGHRLALSDATVEAPADLPRTRMIIPNKGIGELQKLLADDSDAPTTLVFGENHVQLRTEGYVFTSKQVEGQFPDYDRVIPRNGNKRVICDRMSLREVLNRTAILSNEKYRGIRLLLQSGQVTVMANNPEHEEAEEALPVSYEGDSLEMGFNFTYLKDVLDNMGASEQVVMTLFDANSSALIEAAEQPDALYVVMPMRL